MFFSLSQMPGLVWQQSFGSGQISCAWKNTVSRVAYTALLNSVLQ